MFKERGRHDNERAFAQHAEAVSGGKGEVSDIPPPPARGRAEEDNKEFEGNYDAVANGAHYAYGKIECIDAMEVVLEGHSGFKGYLIGQCIKYLWRLGRKGPALLSVKKCLWYLKRLERVLEEEGGG